GYLLGTLGLGFFDWPGELAEHRRTIWRDTSVAAVTSSTTLVTRANQRTCRSNDRSGGSAFAFQSRGHPWRTSAIQRICEPPTTSGTKQHFAARVRADHQSQPQQTWAAHPQEQRHL